MSEQDGTRYACRHAQSLLRSGGRSINGRGAQLAAARRCAPAFLRHRAPPRRPIFASPAPCPPPTPRPPHSTAAVHTTSPQKTPPQVVALAAAAVLPRPALARPQLQQLQQQQPPPPQACYEGKKQFAAGVHRCGGAAFSGGGGGGGGGNVAGSIHCGGCCNKGGFLYENARFEWLCDQGCSFSYPGGGPLAPPAAACAGPCAVVAQCCGDAPSGAPFVAVSCPGEGVSLRTGRMASSFSCRYTDKDGYPRTFRSNC